MIISEGHKLLELASATTMIGRRINLAIAGLGHFLPRHLGKRRAGKSANGSAQSVGRISRRRNPPTAVPEQPSGGLRFANPPYALCAFAHPALATNVCQIRNQLETDGFIDQRSSTRSARMWISIPAMAIATSLCVSVGVTLSQQSH
jgi:hypothetical protein